MTAGTIQSLSVRLQSETGKYLLTGTAECQEEIGTVVEIKD